MLKRFLDKAYRDQKGITGLETAIILIAFVVVAAVFAYTVLSAGLFSSQKSSEAVYTAMEETQSTLELRGGLTAYMSADYDAVPEDLQLSDGGDPASLDEMVTRVQFTVANALGGEPIDLTAPYTVSAVDGANLGDLAAVAGTPHETIITYTDEDHFFSDCAWTLDWIGERDTDQAAPDDMLEVGEKAQITVWLVNHSGDNTSPFLLDDPLALTGKFFSDTDDANGTLLGADHTFTIEVKTPNGAVLVMERTTPSELDPVMDLH